uniref:Uncharacterized protein n=1 Tax=viral metagenome TaxID=1070528 RepID=A0A6C0J4Q1_9ZZZZ
MTKINYEFIQKIFNRKRSLKKEKDKIKLSKYNEYIPMYDIYSDNIYPIHNLKIYYRLTKCHFRFITSEVKQWIKNKMDKTKDKGLILNYKTNLGIIENYHLPTLEKTSYETVYKYSPEMGLSISICKRNSFHPFSTHLTPYYTKNELIKLGMNNKIVSKITPENLVDKDLHYKICKLVSKNDISFDLIYNHMKHIIDTNSINWVNYYSFLGSYIFNSYLRDSKIRLSNYLLDGLKMLVNTIDTAPAFKDNYFFYRFIWDDKFLKKLKVGDTFTDKGFLSTTRDPFYSPGLQMDFGLILVKINIPKNKKGVGLFLENFSMFPKEEEYLIKPESKFKLVAKDDKFDYKHINESFEKKIKQKYEFTFVSNNFNVNKLKGASDNSIPELNLKDLNLSGKDRVDLFKDFLKNCDDMDQFKFKDDIYTCQFFNSTSSYKKLFYNETENGLIVTKYTNGYPELSLECGEKLAVNYIQKLNYHNNDNVDDNVDDNDDDKEVIGLISKLFGYELALIFFPYKNFSEFKSNYKDENINFLYNNLYCYPIYLYFKNGKKHLTDKYFKFSYGYFKLDKIMKTKVPKSVLEKFPDDLDKKLSWKDLLVLVIEKHFYLYSKLEESFNENFDDLFNKCYFEFDSLVYLKNNDYDISYLPNIAHSETRIDNTRFNLIFNDNIRRID